MASAEPLVPDGPEPFPLFHVVAKGLSDELAHGAPLVPHHVLHLLGHVRRQGEGDRFGVPVDEPVGHKLSYSLSSMILRPVVKGLPASYRTFRCQSASRMFVSMYGAIPKGLQYKYDGRPSIR